MLLVIVSLAVMLLALVFLSIIPRCKKCRYEKCLAIGMDPKWVMTPEQKLVRFQHYYKKKMERGTARGTALGTAPGTASGSASGTAPGTAPGTAQSTASARQRFESLQSF